MYQLTNTYTFKISDTKSVVFGPDPSVDNWAGHLTDIAISSDTQMAVSALPGLHGAVVSNANLGALNLTFEVLITGADPAERAMSLRKIDQLSTGYHNPISLTWTEADGIERQLRGLRKSAISPVGHTDGPAKKRVLSFVCPLPYIETRREHQTIVTLSGVVSGPHNTCTGTGTVINAGSADSFPEFKLYGPFTSASVSINNGGLLTINQTIPANEYVLIKTRPTEQGVWHNGQNVYGNLDWVNSTFPTVPPGESEIGYSANDSTSATQVICRWRSSWLL